MKEFFKSLGKVLLNVGEDEAKVIVTQAVKDAFIKVGLPAHQFDESFDLRKAGKFIDVVHTASEQLNVNHNLNTVEDAVRILSKQN